MKNRLYKLALIFLITITNTFTLLAEENSGLVTLSYKSLVDNAHFVKLDNSTHLPNPNEITNLYLYGTPVTPDKVSSDLIRQNVTVTHEIPLSEFMTNGAGRFALGAQFELVQKFFADGASVLEPNSESNPFYSKDEVKSALGLENIFFALDNKDVTDSINDYGARVYIFNNTSFKIVEDAKFIVEAGGDVRIEDFAVIPWKDQSLNIQENFDFDSDQNSTSLANLLLEDAIDPSQIGRTVYFEFIGIADTITYTKNHFISEQATIATWGGGDYVQINTEMVLIANGLWSNSTTRFLDSSNRPIIYGTTEGDRLNNSINGSGWADLNGVPTIDDFAYEDKGVVLIGGAGDDELRGNSKADKLIGGKGNDILVGDESLVGESDGDVSVFSGLCAEYDFTHQSDENWTVSHMRGNMEDGTDSLQGIEQIQFKDGIFNLPTSANATSVCTEYEIVLIIDSTSSMADNDRQNKRIEAAKAYLTASSPGDYVAVVDFDTVAVLKSGLQRIPEGIDVLKSAIDTIDSSGATNIRDGITVACDELVSNGTATKRGAILLTDGQHNVGPFGNPQQCFADNGWPIYTYGFGSADVSLMQTVANDTGGEFTNISQVSNLICEFQRVRAKIAGAQPGPCTALRVGPGETKFIPALVPAEQSQASFSTSWAGSDVVMSLTTPSGRVIDRNTAAPDIRHELGSAFEIYSVTNPEVGNWQVSLFGADVPSTGEEVIFGFTTLPASEIQRADLVVEQVIATENNIQVVIKNQGSGSVSPEQDFWVDVYINPDTPPLAVNDVWDFVGREGLVWGVVAPAVPMPPGATLTLSINDSFYWPSLSNFTGSIPPGTPIYAQIDSANSESTYGGVLESHEAAGGAYNNILGPVLSTSVGSSGQLSEKIYLPVISASSFSAMENTAASSSQSVPSEILPARP